ncbi:hypothetical protein GCM10011532_05690 [Christiangramia forsetii]|uniref:PKD domain-containing protein n=1 Tax=Christiangramia forsetii TaxID=411153 RepID=A0ABQ1WCM3_9FLAO|nr:hypothetical protein GCM10011532_05690 [Christiangramia forsetii]
MIFTTKSSAQKEAGTWYFGDRAGLNFSSGSPVPLTNGQLQTIEGSATISDRDGNLLFYTQGNTVFTRQHNIMPNGEELKGNVSSTQSAIIVPRPGNPLKYFIFTVDKPDYFRIQNDPIEGVHYSEVDMTLNSGRGAIIPNRKNIHLVTYDPNDPLENEYKSSEKISSVISGNCISYWVVTQLSNKFYAFNVSSEGVNSTPVISTIPTSFPPLITDNNLNLTAPGYMKISPDGKKIAIAFTGTSLGNSSNGTKSSGKVYLYDFNDVTGKVTNENLILNNTYPYGVEFSADSKKLYTTANTYNNRDQLQSGELYQFDLERINIGASKSLINTSNNVAGALQLAIDGKIYRAGYPQSSGAVHHNFLSVINNPEANASSVDYDHNSVDISPRDVKLGLPPFVQSLLNNNFDAENFCLGEATKFTINGGVNYDSIKWEFGDGTTSSEESPSHTYSEPGTYVVSLTKFINNIPQDPVCEEVTIIGFDQAAQNYTLTQCDISDDDPDDGLTDFNLQIARDNFTGGDNNIKVLFYEDTQSAQLDDLNQGGLPDIYRNTSAGQTLVAKVTDYDNECASYSEFDLATSSSVEPIKVQTLIGCSTNSEEAEFNFVSITEEVRIELNLNQNTIITFHEDKNEALLGENPLSNNYFSEEKTIYLRVNSDQACYSLGILNLEIVEFPEIQQEYNLQSCSDNFPLDLGNEIGLATPGDFLYEWSTGQNSPTIQVNESGTFILNLIRKNSGCSIEIEFQVEKIEAPEISEIEITNEGSNNTLNVLTNSIDQNTVFALDDIEGPYQSSPIFQNVPGGSHKIYIKNDQACEIGAQEISLYGHPAFFTPNNDGYHDLWRPFDIPDPDYALAGIFIFDRYGKLLIQLPPNTKGWDGTSNGKPMPSDDYWFEVRLQNGKVFNGHFSLVR